MWRASFSVRLAGICGMLMASIPAAHAEDGPTYCPALTRITALINTRERFASIIGQPREGNFRETTLPLPGWGDCSFYGTRTYTCDSRPFATAGEAERAFATTLDNIKGCLRGSWADDRSRTSPGYAVFHDDRQVASITVSTDQTDKSEHVVRLILFLRSSR
jgi:hypothetical protein